MYAGFYLFTLPHKCDNYFADVTVLHIYQPVRAETIFNRAGRMMISNALQRFRFH